MALSAGTRLGPYSIVASIGAGGMGEVYRAKDTRLDRDVAIKILPERLADDPTAVARFEQEARAVAALSHPNILAIHDVGREGSMAFAVMELLDGATLRDTLVAGRLPLRKAVEYGLAIAQGLAAAHAKGIVHRDLKPENVFVSADGHVKILDFGLAKVEARATASDRTTMAATTDPGTVLGTAGYLSPEQAQGRAVDLRSDIFSFGTVLYELATGRRAFTTDSAIDTLHRIVHDQPAPIDEACADAPHELKWILAKCLAKDPDERYQSTRDLVVDLRGVLRVLDSSPQLARVAPGAAIGGSRGWQIGTAAAAAAIVVLTIVVGLVWRGRRASEDSHATAAAQTIERITSIGDVIDAVVAPDGKYVAYVLSQSGQQSLWIRQLATASTLQLVPPAVVGYWGANFTPDSSTVYYVVKGKDHPEGGLYRVPALGGTPREVLTALDSKVVFSPNGRQMAYLRVDFPESGASSLMVADIDGGNVRTLATKRPPDFVAPIFFGAPAWSPDGAFIVCPLEQHRGDVSGTFVAYRATDGAEQAFPREDFPFVGQAAWLPDGRGLVAIGGERSTTRRSSQLWLFTYPDGARRPITNDLLDYRDVSITADASALVTVAADATSSLWVAPLDGSGDARRISSGKYDGIDGLAATPDGRILYKSVAGGVSSVWIADEDGGKSAQVTGEGPGAWPVVLPGGRSLLFVRNGPALWQIGIDGQNARLVKALPSVQYPVVTPDGKWVFFVSTSTGSETLWKMPADGGEPVRVLNALATRPAISPDGTRIAFFYRERPGAQISLAVMPVDGTQPTMTFPGVLSTGSIVRWTADGKALLHTAAPKDRSNVWLQPIDGGPPRQVTHFADQTIFSFDRSGDGKRLIIARGTLSRDAMLIRHFR
jgi:Tol biopolymer transport system component